jgi:hypothetical protein
MNFVSEGDIDCYCEMAGIFLLTRLEVRSIIEYFELCGEQVKEVAETFDLNRPELIKEIENLLHIYKIKGETYDH